MGSARVWDERTRAAAAARAQPAPPEGARPTSLSPLELAVLVRGIVATTLEARLPDTPRERRGALAQELELRLLDLFEARPLAGPPQDLAPAASAAPAAPPAEDHTDRARPTPSAPLEPRARLLDLTLQERLERLGSPLAARADLRERLVALVLQRLASAAAEVEADVPAEELRDLDVLQRRLVKLEQALAEARAALTHVGSLEHVDGGLASIYRVVQGLAAGDPRRAQKTAALECVFRANLALQRPRA
ncbi:MAG TPA: hypothetical protein VF530_08115 [Planctomycetota bacterium]